MATTEQENTTPIVPEGTNAGSAEAAKQQQQQTQQAQQTQASDSTATQQQQQPAFQPAAVTVPQQYIHSNADLIKIYEDRMAGMDKPLNKEQLQQLRRQQRTAKIISGVTDAASALANLFFTTKYAPNMYNPEHSMSKALQAKFDKEKAEREAKEQEWFNYAMQIGKLKGEDADRGLQAWQIAENLMRQDRAYNASRQDHADEVAYRDKVFDNENHWKQSEFDRAGEWHKDDNAHWDKTYGLQAAQLAQSIKQNQTTINLGEGYGNVTLGPDKVNATNVALIFGKLPKRVRDKVRGQLAANGRQDPGPQEMLTAVGQFLSGAYDIESKLNADGQTYTDTDYSKDYAADKTNTRQAIKAVAGQSGAKPKAY